MKIIFILSILFLFSCHNQYQNTTLTNSFNTSLRWKKEVKFYFHKDFPVSKRKIIKEELDSLNKIIGTNMLSVSSKDVLDTDSSKNVIYWNENNKFKKLAPGEQALTSLHWSGDEIIQANMYFSPDFEAFDFRTLFRHELAHALGFKHVDNQEHLMSPFLSIGEEKNYSLEQVQIMIDFYSKLKITAKEGN